MKPKPTTISNASWSIGPPAKSENSGNSTAPTTIMPATRQAARKANRMMKRRPISDMKSDYRHCERREEDARHNRTVVARLDRAIQYAAASRHYRWRLWNTGRIGQAG